MEKIRIAEIEEQLTELAKILNSFKSEAVQLRILDHVLKDGFLSKPSIQPPDNPAREKIHKRSRPNKEKTKSAETGTKKKTKVGSGAKATLSQLVNGDFFNTTRTINDIVEHCKNNLARTFKPNEFSSKLGELVRAGVLTREKNADGRQYEYKKL